MKGEAEVKSKIRAMNINAGNLNPQLMLWSIRKAQTDLSIVKVGVTLGQMSNIDKNR